jgi:hypothetical protein
MFVGEKFVRKCSATGGEGGVRVLRYEILLLGNIKAGSCSLKEEG